MKTLLALVLSFPLLVNAAAIAVAQEAGITVVLTDEPCTLAAVSNLSRRATWEEKGKKYEGCYAVADSTVVAYFAEDRTVTVIPLSVFVKAVNT